MPGRVRFGIRLLGPCRRRCNAPLLSGCGDGASFSKHCCSFVRRLSARAAYVVLPLFTSHQAPYDLHHGNKQTNRVENRMTARRR